MSSRHADGQGLHVGALEILRLDALDATAVPGRPPFTVKEVPKAAFYVIGDTPLDVDDAAHAVGCTAIAVATGPYHRTVLTAARADPVVGTLADERVSARLTTPNVRSQPSRTEEP